jgi:hypothetical protein
MAKSNVRIFRGGGVGVERHNLQTLSVHRKVLWVLFMSVIETFATDRIKVCLFDVN